MDEAETEFGVRFPKVYREIIDAYCSGVFAGSELIFTNHRDPHAPFVRNMDRLSESLAEFNNAFGILAEGAVSDLDCEFAFADMCDI